jgi:hypothetical protein
MYKRVNYIITIKESIRINMINNQLQNSKILSCYNRACWGGWWLAEVGRKIGKQEGRKAHRKVGRKVSRKLGRKVGKKVGREVGGEVDGEVGGRLSGS